MNKITVNKVRKLKPNPKILVVTPEITFLPDGMGNMANNLQAKGGGLADVTASLVSNLFEQGVDVHVALPHYRKLFNIDTSNFYNGELRLYKKKLPNDRIHLAEDRAFYYREHVYDVYSRENINIALKFQREVINNIIPRVKPDLIHCNDWMTGLIPAFAKRLGIPCIFTVHNIHTVKSTMAEIEDNGIDCAEFWQYLYFERMPESYFESRETNSVDFLTSGIFASDYVNTVSPTFLDEIVLGEHNFVDTKIRQEIRNKVASQRASGVLNSPDPIYNPESDKNLARNYNSQTHNAGKLANKRLLQELLDLEDNDEAPLFFWPSRLDPVQKGCQLLSDILYELLCKYSREKLQVVLISTGPHQKYFKDIVRMHKLKHNVAIRDYDRSLASLAFAASDFLLMPSLYEPCGLPQMICQKYGSLPIVRDTGGLHDTVTSINLKKETGNGFVFEDYDSNGLSWAVDQAMKFFKLPMSEKDTTISRVMDEANRRYNQAVTASQYVKIYEDLLNSFSTLISFPSLSPKNKGVMSSSRLLYESK